MSTEQLPRVADPQDAALIRRLLTDQYTESGLIDRLGTSEPPLPKSTRMARMMDATRALQGTDVLIRWFFLGRAVAIDAARKVISGTHLERLCACDLVRAEGECFAAKVLIVPCDDFLLACDSFQRLASPEHADHVLAPNPTSRHLLKFMMKRPVTASLDLGTGNGIMALALARQSAQVTATDLNRRAIHFAAFNAALNGIANISFLAGDRFAPVAGRQFDHIISNPPFIIVPSSTSMYRDNPEHLDAFCRGIVQSVPAYLNDGGFAQIILEWAELQGEAWKARLAAWFAGLGCDALVLKANSYRPETYAQSRLQELEQEDPALPTEQRYRDWMDFYRGHGVRGIHGGLIAMRKRTGKNWLEFHEISAPPPANFGAEIALRFANLDLVHGNEDADLLNLRLRLAPGAQLSRELLCKDGQWMITASRLSSQSGLAGETNLQHQIGDFLASFDGTPTLAQRIGQFAPQVNADATTVQAECLRIIRTLLAAGFLEAAADIEGEAG